MSHENKVNVFDALVVAIHNNIFLRVHIHCTTLLNPVPLPAQNAGAEVSMEWVLAHMEDPDFNNPLPEASAAAGGSGGGGDSSQAADPESVAMLSSMGFTDVQASAALKVCSQCGQ